MNDSTVKMPFSNPGSESETRNGPEIQMDNLYESDEQLEQVSSKSSVSAMSQKDQHNMKV